MLNEGCRIAPGAGVLINWPGNGRIGVCCGLAKFIMEGTDGWRVPWSRSRGASWELELEEESFVQLVRCMKAEEVVRHSRNGNFDVDEWNV